MKLFYARSNSFFWVAKPAVFRHATPAAGWVPRSCPDAKKQGLGDREQGVEKQAPKNKGKSNRRFFDSCAARGATPFAQNDIQCLSLRMTFNFFAQADSIIMFA